jgi:hypothetical protein
LFCQQPCQVRVLETGEPEVESLLVKRFKFDTQHLVVPAGVLGQPVVGDDISPLLCLAQVENDDWHFSEPKFSGGKQAPVAGYDSRVRIDQDGVVEAELGDAGGKSALPAHRSACADFARKEPGARSATTRSEYRR